MKIVVMSDSHGSYSAVKKVFDKHPDADLFIHLGDGEREMNTLLLTNPQLQDKLCYLKGNCDYGHLVFRTENELALTLPFGHRLFAAHGDKYQVKFGPNRMKFEARALNADIMLYGHTHVRECTYEDGLYIINPGSLGCPRDGLRPSYALIDVSESGIMPNIVLL